MHIPLKTKLHIVFRPGSKETSCPKDKINMAIMASTDMNFFVQSLNMMSADTLSFIECSVLRDNMVFSSYVQNHNNLRNKGFVGNF